MFWRFPAIRSRLFRQLAFQLAYRARPGGLGLSLASDCGVRFYWEYDESFRAANTLRTSATWHNHPSASRNKYQEPAFSVIHQWRFGTLFEVHRSEERRVGKECRSRW